MRRGIGRARVAGRRLDPANVMVRATVAGAGRRRHGDGGMRTHVREHDTRRPLGEGASTSRERDARIAGSSGLAAGMGDHRDETLQRGLFAVQEGLLLGGRKVATGDRLSQALLDRCQHGLDERGRALSLARGD